MEITFDNVKTNNNSLEKELIFSFLVSDISEKEIPISINGELFTEEGYKIGNLKDSIGKNHYYELYLNATEVLKNLKKNNEFVLNFSCVLSDKAINHIENYRLNVKDKTKDVIFNIKFEVLMQKSNVTLAHLHLGGVDPLNSGDEKRVYYKYVNEYYPPRNDMWVLSGESSPNFLNYRKDIREVRNIKIDLMTWVNDYTKYLGIGEFLVLEFIQPDDTIYSKEMVERYEKAQGALVEMKKQFGYGEWKYAIIALRPVFELFKNFDEFKKLLVDNDYTEQAYSHLKMSIEGYFGLISKFYHGLDKNYTDVNPDIPVFSEDAYFAYTYAVSIMNLISGKIKRKLS